MNFGRRPGKMRSPNRLKDPNIGFSGAKGAAKFCTYYMYCIDQCTLDKSTLWAMGRQPAAGGKNGNPVPQTSFEDNLLSHKTVPWILSLS